MIRIVIEVGEQHGQPIDAGGYPLAGVNVRTEPFNAKAETESVGSTWAGLCMAINDFMRSRGAVDFDCLKQLQHPITKKRNG